jgi:hypothetical protein
MYAMFIIYKQKIFEAYPYLVQNLLVGSGQWGEQWGQHWGNA